MRPLKFFSAAASLFFLAAVSVSAETPIVLFQDGFENSVTGAPPAEPDPTVGSYLVTGANANNPQVVSGPTVDGPDGAIEGTHYLRYNRPEFGGSPLIHALFASPLFATNTPFHVSFYKWRPDTPSNYPQIILGTGTAVNNLVQLIYTTDWPGTLNWRWYDGSAYNDTALVFNSNNWDFVEMDFDGTTMSGRINGGAADAFGLFGSSDKPIDRVLFRAGGGGTIFYLDDIKVTTTAPILVQSFTPANGASGVPRVPLIQVQIADGAQSVQTGTIQMFVNGAQVNPTVTQTNASGFNTTTISYVPSAPLAYGSSNTVTCTFSDDAAPPNQYTESWTFSVYTGDPIFADNFDSSTQEPVLPPVQLGAFEGANCLRMARIGSGRPALLAIGDLNMASVANDTVTLTLAFAPSMNLGQRGVLGVIPGYATETNGEVNFNQTGQINLFDDGLISIVDVTGKINQYLTQTLNTDAWNTVAIQYVNGSGEWFVSANGAPFESYFGKSSQGGTPNDNVNGFLIDTTGVGYMWFDDLVLSNTTENALLFSDGFETAAVGDIPETNSPTVGVYSTVDPGSADGGLLVVNGVNSTNYVDAPPNAPQLGSYDASTTTALAFNGAHHSGSKSLNLTNGQARTVFTTPIPTDIKLHAETYINWQAGNVSWGLDAEGDDQFARITLNNAFGITLFDGANEMDTGYGHALNAWEKYELDYVVGSDSITFTVNGYPVTLSVTPRSSIKGLFFTEDGSQASQAYVDDVMATASLGDIPATDPLLSVAQNGSQLILSWTNAAGYSLQENDDLTDPNGWINVPAGGISPVQVPMNGAVFYRLAKPY